MSCRTGCPTQDCESYTACLKGMRLHLGDLGSGERKIVDKRLNSYAYARSLGLQPPSTKTKDSQATLRAAGA